VDQKDLILEIKDLKINIHLDEGILTAVRGVNLHIAKGETLGIVGESGCGKSLTSKAILGINDQKCKTEGEVFFETNDSGRINLLTLNPQGREIREIRGKQISMIFQEPMVAFSPLYTIGNQINESTMLHISNDQEQSNLKPFPLK
jgi:peptide/nickel transport system ATP-binding protein